MVLIQAFQVSIARLKERFHRRPDGRHRKESPNRNTPPLLSDTQRAAYFHGLANDQDAAKSIDDRTWSDLEMDLVFCRLDRSLTPLGTQYLYAVLRQSNVCHANAQENERIRPLLWSEPKLAERLRIALKNASSKEAAEVAELLLSQQPHRLPPKYRLFYAVSVIAMVLPLGLFLSPWFFPACLTFWVACIALHCLYRSKILAHGPALSGLASVLACMPQLARALKDSGLPDE